MISIITGKNIAFISIADKVDLIIDIYIRYLHSNHDQISQKNSLRQGYPSHTNFTIGTKKTRYYLLRKSSLSNDQPYITVIDHKNLLDESMKS